MEFAPEYRNGQFTEWALYSTFGGSPRIDYFHGIVWFEGGEKGIWTEDSLNLTLKVDPMPLTVGRHQLSGNNLGNSDDCTICIDLIRSDLDHRIDADFYPEDVFIDVEAVGTESGSPLKFTVSGIFREDADPKKRSWCVNGLSSDTVVRLYCTGPESCPADMPVCDYLDTTSNYPICMTEEEADGGE